MKTSSLSFKPIVFCVSFFIFLSSCVSTQKVLYLDNIQNRDFPDEEVENIIQKNDLLSITVNSLNPEATIIFNTPNSSTSSAVGSGLQAGYLVNAEGDIIFPILGKIRVAGITSKQVRDNLTEVLLQKKLLIDPIVNVRILNFKVTVLGEVARPTVVPVASEKISMLEAIGMAGDMTLYAQRDKVLLIRAENGKKITRRVNLNSPDFLTSPYYYLKTNDIVYVEPNKAKVATTDRSQQLLPIILSGLSIVVVVITSILR